MPLGERIKSVRQALGLKGEELADKLGVKKQSVSNWETNKNSITVDNLLKLAELGDVDPLWLLMGDDPAKGDALERIIRSLTREQRNFLYGVAKTLKDTPENPQPKKSVKSRLTG